MDAGKGTDSTKSEKPIIVPDDEDDEAASVVAGLTIQEEPILRLIKAQLDLLRYLITKAQTANDRLLIGHATDERLRTDAKMLRAITDLIAQIESNDYMCKPEDQEELQDWMHKLTSMYAGGSDTDARIARVIAVERSMGLGDASDETWGT